MLIVLLGLGLLTGIVLIFVSRAKHKARADTLDEVMRTQNAPKKTNLDELERLNKLRESGALTQEEFEQEKKKVLGQ